MEEVLDHVAAWEPHIKALYLFDPDRRARRRPGIDRPLAEGRTRRHARRRTGHDQGQHRDQGPADSAGCSQRQAGPRREGCAARRAIAGSRRDHLRQDHDAGLRHAVVGPLQFPSPHPQPLGPDQERRAAPLPAPALPPRPVTARCIWVPTSAVRYGCRAAWCGLVALKPSLGRVPIRSTLCRPRRRPDDPHRRRCRR